jgi:hypothetical protein
VVETFKIYIKIFIGIMVYCGIIVQEKEMFKITVTGKKDNVTRKDEVDFDGTLRQAIREAEEIAYDMENKGYEYITIRVYDETGKLKSSSIDEEEIKCQNESVRDYEDEDFDTEMIMCAKENLR